MDTISSSYPTLILMLEQHISKLITCIEDSLHLDHCNPKIELCLLLLLNSYVPEVARRTVLTERAKEKLNPASSFQPMFYVHYLSRCLVLMSPAHARNFVFDTRPILQPGRHSPFKFMALERAHYQDGGDGQTSSLMYTATLIPLNLLKGRNYPLVAVWNADYFHEKGMAFRTPFFRMLEGAGDW